MQPNPRSFFQLPIFHVRHAGYQLPDIDFALIIPEATTNLIENPSFENDLKTWYGAYSSIARVNTFQTSGAYSVEVTPIGTNTGAILESLLQSPTAEPRMTTVNYLSLDFNADTANENYTIQLEKVYLYDKFRDRTIVNGIIGAPPTVSNYSSITGWSVSSGNLTNDTNNGYLIGNQQTTTFSKVVETKMNGDYNNGTNYRRPLLILQSNNAVGTYAGDNFMYVELSQNTIALRKSLAGVDSLLQTTALTLTPGTAVTVRAELLQVGGVYTVQIFADGVSKFTYTLTAGEITNFQTNQYSGYGVHRGGSPSVAIAFEGIKVVANPANVFNSYNFTSQLATTRLGMNATGITGDSTFPFILLSIKKTTLTTGKFRIDAVQLEPKSYPTTYTDGDQIGSFWDGQAHNSSSDRLYNPTQPGGRRYKFSDLYIKVVAATGLGLPPINNQTQENAFFGGENYQRSIPDKRSASLSCVIEAENIDDLMVKRQNIEALLAPSNLDGLAKFLILQAQLIDCAGASRGQILQATVIYNAGMQGDLSTGYQENFSLVLDQLQLPGVTEFYPLYKSLTAASTLNTNNSFLHRFNRAWSVGGNVGVGETGAVIYDSNNNRQYGGTANIYGIIKNVTFTSVPVNATVNALAGDQTTGNTYAGGGFTTPSAQIFSYDINGNVTAVGTGGAGKPTATVRALCFDNSGLLYVGGDFTTPAGRIATYNTSSGVWAALGTGANGIVRAIAKGKDGAIYAGGDFTTFNGVSMPNSMVKIVGSTYTSLGSASTNGVILTLAIGPDGRLYAGGTFTAINGISANRVAVWNGTQWSALGVGVNNNVRSLAFDKDGLLWIGGVFTALGDSTPITNFLCVWNGSNFLPADIQLNTSLSRVDAVATSGLDMAIGTVPAAGNSNIGAQTTITYTGSAGAPVKVIFKANGNTFALWRLDNLTTGKSIYFNYTLAATETVTLDLNPRSLSFVSNIYGSLPGELLPGSDFGSFGLVPGDNILSFLGVGSTGTADLFYKNTHWNYDRVAS